MARGAAKSGFWSERRRGCVGGLVAASLLWAGLDGSLAHAFDRLVRLPRGVFGDALAFVAVAAWAVVTAAAAWWAFTGRPLLRRPKPLRRAKRNA